MDWTQDSYRSKTRGTTGEKLQSYPYVEVCWGQLRAVVNADPISLRPQMWNTWCFGCHSSIGFWDCWRPTIKEGERVWSLRLFCDFLRFFTKYPSCLWKTFRVAQPWKKVVLLCPSFRARKDSEVFVTEAFKEEKKSSNMTKLIDLATEREKPFRRKFLYCTNWLGHFLGAQTKKEVWGWVGSTRGDGPAECSSLADYCTRLTFDWSSATVSSCPRCDATNPLVIAFIGNGWVLCIKDPCREKNCNPEFQLGLR